MFKITSNLSSLGQSESIPPCPLTTPVLFLTFNRPETTGKVFEAIRKARPLRLFVAADGPRPHRPGEGERCQKTREIVTAVDWNCEVRTLFRKENLGCKASVSSAIDWFFEHVKEGIILEDDCWPCQEFFWFCQMLLERYRDDKRVMMISGTNYLFDQVSIDESYFFSKYYAIWGWATWKRSWELYDRKVSHWLTHKRKKSLTWLYPSREIVKFYTGMFDAVYNDKINTWDIQWCYSCIFNNGLAIVPAANLISNIGIEGTHTGRKPSRFIQMPVRAMNLNAIRHPRNVTPHILCDTVTFRNVLSSTGGPKRRIGNAFRELKNRVRGNSPASY
ncbi:MAG: glycosyltransferase family 2 protein [bacterium]